MSSLLPKASTNRNEPFPSLSGALREVGAERCRKRLVHIATERGCRILTVADNSTLRSTFYCTGATTGMGDGFRNVFAVKRCLSC